MLQHWWYGFMLVFCGGHVFPLKAVEHKQPRPAHTPQLPLASALGALGS